MPRPKKELWQKRSVHIKVYMTETEKQMFLGKSENLKSFSPLLNPAGQVLRHVAFMIDDIALLEFLNLASDHPIKIKLRNDYIFKDMK